MSPHVTHVSLSVTDPTRSARWYAEVLGFAIDTATDGDALSRVRLRHHGCGITLTLTCHHESSDAPAQDTGSGLDHLAFRAPSVNDLEAWKARFERLDVDHSDIELTVGPSGAGARLAMRDPDHIHLQIVADARTPARLLRGEDTQ